MSAAWSRPVFVLRRNWLVPAVALVLAGIGTQLGLAGILLTVLAIPFAIVSMTRNAFPIRRATMLLADAQALTLDGRAIPAVDIIEARVVGKNPRQVRLELAVRNRPRLTLALGAEDARALLDLLGATAGQRRARFKLTLPLALRLALSTPVTMTAMVLRALAIDLPLPFAILWGVALGFIGALALGLVPGSILIGADGFATRWLFRRRMVSFADVRDLVSRPSRLGEAPDTLVVLRSGRRIRLSAREAPVSEADRGAEARALFEHLSEARARFGGGAADARVAALLAPPAGASPGAWLRAIGALVDGSSAGYRGAAVTPEQLVAITREPTQTKEARVAAAAGLIRVVGDEARVRIRVAAEASTDGDLRDALHALEAARTDEDIEGALARFASRRA